MFGVQYLNYHQIPAFYQEGELQIPIHLHWVKFETMLLLSCNI